MFQHVVYKCPKCMNILLVSNKMLHDLRCTIDNPATYENVLYRQSQQMANDGAENYKCPNSAQRLSSRMSITNDDGTMIDIKKEKNFRGIEEYIETKYDKEGNVLSKKRADSLLLNYANQNNNFHELDEYNQYDDDDYNSNYDNNNNTYYEMNKDVEIRRAPSIIYETAEAQEFVYTAPAKYDPHVIINKPIEETIINSDGNLSENIVNRILRNSTGISNYTNNVSTNDYNIQNDNNNNGYDYTQNTENNNIDTTNYNQNYETNDYNQNNGDNQFNYNGQENYNEQYNLGNQNNINNDEYNTNHYTNNGSSDIIGNYNGMNNMDYNSYDYKY